MLAMYLGIWWSNFGTLLGLLLLQFFIQVCCLWLLLVSLQRYRCYITIFIKLPKSEGKFLIHFNDIGSFRSSLGPQLLVDLWIISLDSQPIKVWMLFRCAYALLISSILCFMVGEIWIIPRDCCLRLLQIYFLEFDPDFGYILRFQLLTS